MDVANATSHYDPSFSGSAFMQRTTILVCKYVYPYFIMSLYITCANIYKYVCICRKYSHYIYNFETSLKIQRGQVQLVWLHQGQPCERESICHLCLLHHTLPQ